MIQFQFLIDGLSDDGLKQFVRLPFDPASAFTWIDADVFRVLGIKAFRRRRMVIPGTDQIAWVETVVVGVSWQTSMRGVDEVAVAPDPKLQRLGRRTLHALQARIAQADGEPILVPHRPVVSYDELWRRARLVSQTDFPDEPIEQDDFALASLAFSVLMRRVARRDEFSLTFFVAELRVMLTRVLGCRAVDVWEYSHAACLWSRRGKSTKFEFPHSIQELLAIAACPKVTDERLLAWRFPSQKCENLIEPAALFAVAPETADEAAFLRRFMDLISPAIDLLFIHSNLTVALRESRDAAGQLLRLDRNREGVVSYKLLDHAKRVLPTWSHTSFWRTSRTTGSLERTAEYNFEERSVRLDSIVEWRRESVLTSVKSRDLPLIAAIAIPKESDIHDDSTEQAQLIRMLNNPRRICLTTTQKASYRVYLSDHQADNATAVQENLVALFDHLNLGGTEIVVDCGRGPCNRDRSFILSSPWSTTSVTWGALMSPH